MFKIPEKIFQNQFECSRQSAEKYRNFWVPIIFFAKDKLVSCNLNFIDNIRLMTRSLSSLDDNHSEKIYKGKCIDNKSFLEFASVKYGLLILTQIIRKSLTTLS